MQFNVISIDFFPKFFIIENLNIRVVFFLKDFHDFGFGHFCYLDVEKVILVDKYIADLLTGTCEPQILRTQAKGEHVLLQSEHVINQKSRLKGCLEVLI